MKLFFLLLLFFPAISFCQQQGTPANNAKNELGDSVSAQMLSQKYSAAHQLMVSFTSGNTAGLNNFWTYLLSELHYTTDKPNTLVLKPAKSGLSTSFYKYDMANEQLPPSITVNLNCNRDGSNLQSAYITGSANLLNELFVHYFGGVMKTNSPAKGGFVATYTQTDEVRLFSDKIMIQPLHHTVSTE